MSEPEINVIKVGTDVAAMSLTAAVLAKWLPPIAAGLSCIWLSMQILDYIFVKRKIHKCIANLFRKIFKKT